MKILVTERYNESPIEVEFASPAVDFVFSKAKEYINKGAYRVSFETPDCRIMIERHTDIGFKILGKWK